MADYITTRQYAELHGIPFETVRTWTKNGKLPTIKIGGSVMIEASAPIPAKRKPGVKTQEEKNLAEFNKTFKSKQLKVEITRAYLIGGSAYLVSVVDGTGKEVASDFTFCGKEGAKLLGERMKKEVESQRMNEILRSLIKWTEENEVVPEIYFKAECGGIWLNLILRKHSKCMQHAFYIPGGVLCLKNWDMFPMEEEVNCFIEEAKAQLIKRKE